MLEKHFIQHLSDKDRQRYMARQSLAWIYDAAVQAHRQFLVSKGVHDCDAQRCLEDEHLSRRRMYELVLQVMSQDEGFAEMIAPCIATIEVLFEDES